MEIICQSGVEGSQNESRQVTGRFWRFLNFPPKVSPETAEIVNVVAKFAPTGQNLSSLGFRVIIRTYQDRIPGITIRRAVFVY